jgi:hypothetical protein
MRTRLNRRTALACVSICFLFVTGLILLTTRQSQASNNSAQRSSTPTVNKTGPPDKTIDKATRGRVSEAFGKLPLSFEENRGQVNDEVKYISRGAGYTLFLTPTEAVLALRQSDSRKMTNDAVARRPRVPAQPRPARESVLRMKLRGANPAPAVKGEDEMGVKTNYFIGNEPEKWQTNVARYERVRYEQVYPGIDMIYYGEQQQLEYDFEVAPGADARRIALEFTGVRRLKIERRTGDLVLKTAGGEVRQQRPVAYQEVGGERREVACRYVMQGTRKVGIEVSGYDRTKRLVIDPVLSYSTYLGGNGEDYGFGIAVDSSGHAYVTGWTSSTDFPTLNEYQTWRSNFDAFVTKLDTNASGAASLLYSTYLGGNGGDYGDGIAVDASGIAYVTGSAGPNFPTLNPYQTNYRSYGDVFVTKLDTNASGAASLLYSTYLGGSEFEESGNLALDSSGKVYVTGYTQSTDFPTLNEYQTAQVGSDVYVTKLDTNISGAASLLYSTYLGGNGGDYGYGITVDASGIAYVTGETDSSDFPTLNEYQTYQVGRDAFVTKLDTNASGVASLLYSTYLGGSSHDIGFGIAVDASGNAYVIGYTQSTDFPTLNEYQTAYQNGLIDTFVTKLINSHINISGRVTMNTATGAGVAGVTVTLKDGAGSPPRTATTASDGTYSFAGVSVLGNYTLTPSKTGLTFNPTQIVLNNVTANQLNKNFVAKKAYAIVGVVRLGPARLSGVTVKLTSPSPAGFAPRTATTNSSGVYSFPNLPPGRNYIVTPTKPGYQLTPTSKAINNLSANQTAVDFAVKVNSITGRITRTNTTTGISAVTMTLTSPAPANFPARTLRTDSTGTYTFTNLPAGRNYTIKPVRNGFTFTPQTRSITNLSNNIPAGASTNFTGAGP